MKVHWYIYLTSSLLWTFIFQIRLLNMSREDSSESSSSRSDRSRQNRIMENSDRNCSYNGSQCGIKSLNGYCDKLSGIIKVTKIALVESNDDDGKSWACALASDHKNGQYSSAACAGVASYKNDNHAVLETAASASAEVGYGGAIAEVDADVKVYSYEDKGVKVEAVKVYTGAGLGIGPGGVKAKMEAGVDGVKFKGKFNDKQEINAKVGINANTGIEIGLDGFDVSVLGFGLSLGRNSGLSLPFVGLNVKLW